MHKLRAVFPCWFALVPLATGCGSKPATAPTASVALLPAGEVAVEFTADTPEQLTLYSIDGRMRPKENWPTTKEKFGNYPLLGKLEIKDPAKIKELFDAVKGALPRSYVPFATCFNPRHALRTVEHGKTIDYVICFECNNVRINRNGKTEIVPITSKPQALLNKQLTDAGIPLAPGSVEEK